MKNKTLLLTLILVSLTSILLTTSILPIFSQSKTAPPDRVSFFCKDIYDQASEQKIPATLAWIPERQGNVRVIGWKSEYFNKKGWNPQKRCQEVTSKFQQAYDNGQLNFLTTGKVKGYPIVCSVSQTGESCNEKNQLFTIKPHDNPDLVLQQLMDIVTGKISDMIVQSSGEQTYVSMKEFFSQTPIHDKDAPNCTGGGGAEEHCDAPNCTGGGGAEEHCDPN